MTAFAGLFGRPPSAFGRAHGRVNLIGEHTDYNDGLVLPLAIPQSVLVEVAARPDRCIQAWSAETGPDELPLRYELGDETPGRGWLDHIQGVTHVLAEAGHAVAGFDAAIRSTVPMGAGLASSAALAVALLHALDALDGRTLDRHVLAGLAQASERTFVGADVGIMDPMAALLARPDRALLLDTRSLETRDVPLPPDAEIVVVDSRVRHRHADGGYNVRRGECREACRVLGVASLRNLEDGGPAWEKRLSPVLRRRVRHVLSENQRVRGAVAALDRGDLPGLGRLLGESHASLRDDFEVSTPELDVLVERAQADAEVFGARLTGGGFGGSIVAVARRGCGLAAGTRIAADYRARTGRDGWVLLPLAPGA